MPKIILLCDQPWQTQAQKLLADKLRSIGEFEIHLILVDYFTFIHGRDILNQVSRSSGIFTHTQEEMYKSWQRRGNPDRLDCETKIAAWCDRNPGTRDPDSLAFTNQWTNGFERSFFYLPINSFWQRRILGDSLVWVENLLNSINPDFILSVERSTLVTNIFHDLAKERNIPFRSFIPARVEDFWILLDGLGLESKNLVRIDRVANAQSDFSDGTRLRVEIATHRTESYSSLEGKLLESRTQRRNIFTHLFLDSRKLSGRIFDRLFRQRKIALFKIRRLEQNLFKLTLLEIKQLSIQYFHQWRIFKIGLTECPKYDYILWGLHSRPEGSVLTLGPNEDEIDLLLDFAKILPKSVKLVVKENPEMLGLRRFGFYRKLGRYPNLQLADPFLPSFPLIKNAKGVVGISGTILLEAAILGTPSFALGAPEFRNFIGNHGAKDVGHFIDQICHSTHSSFDYSLIDAYLQYILVSGLRGVPQESDLDNDRAHTMIAKLAELVELELKAGN